MAFIHWSWTPGRISSVTQISSTVADPSSAICERSVTGEQPVLALISAYYNIFGAVQQKLEYVSELCAAHGVEVWALTTKRE